MAEDKVTLAAIVSGSRKGENEKWRVTSINATSTKPRNELCLIFVYVAPV